VLTLSSANATIRVNGAVVASGGSVTIALDVGDNTVTIEVTAASATARTYTITITRADVTVGVCALIPQETQGPFPLLSILSNAAVVRADITDAEQGVPLTLLLNLVNLNAGCAPITDAAVYVWHCDKDGNYSGYGNFVGETFLRGVQVADSAGQVRFTTIFPGWYAGRITHIHFQVYLHDNLRTTATATSQLGFLQSITQSVYTSSLYAARGQNTSVAGFAQDNVFSDGTSLQLASVTGDIDTGLVATLQVGIAA
jgi:protocatechuate 3,4-dioxygenase beta subunit